jgi:hypothetical protein
MNIADSVEAGCLSFSLSATEVLTIPKAIVDLASSVAPLPSTASNIPASAMAPPCLRRTIPAPTTTHREEMVRAFRRCPQSERMGGWMSCDLQSVVPYASQGHGHGGSSACRHHAPCDLGSRDACTCRTIAHCRMLLQPFIRYRIPHRGGGSEQPPRSYPATLRSHRQASMISRASRRSRVRCGSWMMSLFQTRVPLWDLRSHMSYDTGAAAGPSGC